MWRGVTVSQKPAPDALPLSVEKMAHRLRVHDLSDQTDPVVVAERDLIAELIRAAVAMVDGPDGRGYALMRQTWAKVFDHLHGDLLLPGAPIKAVDLVELRDPDGVWQDIPPTDYDADFAVEPAVIRMNNSRVTPGASGRSGVRVIYRLGEDDPADLDQAAVGAVAMLVAHWYANREAVLTGSIASEIPWGVETMLSRISRRQAAA